MFSTDHEAICFCRDEKEDLKAIIAIHSTQFGPACGGTRMFAYSSEEEALADVCDLSRAMTYKAAAADLPFGGGKAVLIADPKDPGKKGKLRAFCKFVNLFNGSFQTGEDLGTNVDDMEYMRRFSHYVHHGSRELPEYLQTSALTARGVLHGIAACLEQVFGKSDVTGRHVAIQGTGKVGSRLARLLREKGARVTIADINDRLTGDLAAELGIDVVSPDRIESVEADIFAPCAAGHVLNESSLLTLRAPIVAGCANNQLTVASIADTLHQRGILYAPDYVINAGGLMSATLEMGIEDQQTMLKRVDGIGDRLLQIFGEAKRQNCSPLRIVDRQVEMKLGGVKLPPEI
jgi:leucine dehydrogenase